MIKQLQVSGSVKFFADKMMRKYDLVPCTDIKKPVIIFGLYNGADYSFYSAANVHVVVWCGTDARMMQISKAAIIKKKNVRHYAMSIIVKKSLQSYGIKAELAPITPTMPDIDPERRGDSVYCYIGNGHPAITIKYRIDMLKKLEASLPYKFIYTTFNKYTRDELMDVYKQCFIGLRLLDHDGLSNTILEMGMMGRRTISNNGIPYTIRWKGFDDIKASIINEYKHRGEDNTGISRDIKAYITIDDSWKRLNT